MPTQERWQTAAVSYQVYQLMVLVARALGGKSDAPVMSVADFLITLKQPAPPPPPKSVEQATEEAMAMFGDLVAAANGQL